MAQNTVSLANGNRLCITRIPASWETEEYDVDDRLVRRQRSDGTWSTWGRDGDNRCESHHLEDGSWWSAIYNARGKRVHYENSDGVSTT
jgi:hypothetical protein